MAYTKEQRAANAAKKAEGGVNEIPSSASIPYKATKSTAVRLPLDTLVRVVNGHTGRLVYKSKKNTGFKIVFEKFGDFEEMELSELLSAKNSQPKFFSKKWFLIEDKDVIEYLRVNKYYENALTLEEFEEIFDKPDAELIEIISKLSDGQKASLANKAREMIDVGEIDSRKKIETLEKALGVQLVEIQ